MRVLFLSDTHLGHDWPLRPRSERRRRGKDFFDTFDVALEYAQQERVDLVLHGGDMFYRSKVPPFLVDMVYERWLRFVEQSSIPVGMIAGNHERAVLPSSLLLSHPLIHVFHEPSAHTFCGVRVTGVPFCGNGARFAFHAHSNADAHLLIAHEAFEGSAVEGFVFRDREDVVPLEDLPDTFDAILSGHIHRRQVLWRTRRDGSKQPILYAGSTERTSFAERNEEKGFAVLDLSSRKVKFVPLPAKPMLEIDEPDDDDLLDALARIAPGSVVRVTCSATQSALLRRAMPGLSTQLSLDVRIRE